MYIMAPEACLNSILHKPLPLIITTSEPLKLLRSLEEGAM
jgi:hypothetical protein